MKRKPLLFLMLFIIPFIFAAHKSEGQVAVRIAPLKEVKIGNQIWTAGNIDLPMPRSWYYDKDSINNNRYGRLYWWSNAMAAVPKGWHLPSLDEWKELIEYCGGDAAGGKLMEGGETGLNLQLGGHLSANLTTDLLFDMKEFKGFYWTSTEKTAQTAWAVVFTKGSWFVEKNYFRKANGFSVRLVKDEASPLAPLPK